MDKMIHLFGEYFMTANLIFFVINLFFEPYCIRIFYGHFMEERFPDKLWAKVGLWVFHDIWTIGFNIFSYFVELPLEISLIRNWLFSICAMLIPAIVFYKACTRMVLFVIVTFQAIGGACGAISGVFLNATDISYYVAEMALLYLSIQYVVKRVRIKDFHIHKDDLLVFWIPGVEAFFIWMLVNMMEYIVGNYQSSAYEEMPLFGFIVLGLLFLTLISILHGMKVFQDRILFRKEISDRTVLEQQTSSMQEYIREMERILGGIRSLKHDMRNTLSVVSRLSAGNTPEEQAIMQTYLSGMQDAVEQLEMPFHTGNQVADTILGIKYHEAIQTLPELVIDVDMLYFPDNLVIQSYDIGIILGNALDNALEACKEQKDKEPDTKPYVRISSSQKRNVFLLEMENTFTGEIVMTGQSEFPTTRKADKELHGIGLANIKRAAEKYQGAVDWCIEDRRFILSVMLKNTESLQTI